MIEKSAAERLERYFRAKKIKGILFDLDDTLLGTNKIFVEATNKCWSVLEEMGGIPKSEIRGLWPQLNKATMLIHRVNPIRWRYIENLINERYKGRNGCVSEAMSFFDEIYTTSPEWLPGARETVELVKSTGVKLGLNTHANIKWTKQKIEERGLGDLFNTIVVADENKAKGPESWCRLRRIMNVPGDECVVVGDNVRGDMGGGKRAGITRGLLIPSPFDQYAEGKVPPGVVRIDTIDKLSDGIWLLPTRRRKVYN